MGPPADAKKTVAGSDGFALDCRISLSNQFIAIGLCVIVEARSFALSLKKILASGSEPWPRTSAGWGTGVEPVRSPLWFERRSGFKLRLRSLVPQAQFANVV